jgi:hypothetical protein
LVEKYLKIYDVSKQRKWYLWKDDLSGIEIVHEDVVKLHIPRNTIKVQYDINLDKLNN